MLNQTHLQPEKNNDIQIAVIKLSHFRGELPQMATAGSSGFDVRAQLTEPVMLAPSGRVLIPTGLIFEIPLGYEIQVRPRSGWAIKEGITLLNTPGTIDSDYRGELKVILINLGHKRVEIQDQDRIAQLVVAPVVRVLLKIKTEISSTERGTGGFGSTGRA